VVRYFTKTVFQGGAPWTITGTVTIAGPLAVTQSGAWTTGRTWTLSFVTDSVTVTGTVGATQSGAWTVASAQSGAWSCGRTWTLDAVTDSVACSPTTWNLDLANWAYFISRNAQTTIQVGDSALLTNAVNYAQDVANTFLPVGNLSRAPSIHAELSAQPKNWYAHINVAAVVPVSATPCVLHTITINQFPGTVMIITISDGLNVVGVITTPAFASAGFWTPPVTLHYNVACSTSLTVRVVSVGAFDLTVAYVN
jgi:hypothetical protein